MKTIYTKLKFIFFFLIFAAISVENPAPSVFTTSFGTQFGGRDGILAHIIKLFLGIIGLVSIAYIMIGGFQIANSRGDSEAAAKGKKTLTNAIIGLVVIILSYVIVTVVVNAAFGKI